MSVGLLINGHRYSFSSIEIVAKIGATDQEIFTDVDEISYNESLAIDFKHGTARVPLGSTAGVWEPQEISMKMGKSTFTSMVMAVGPGWLGINMAMLVTYSDIAEILTADALLCRITGAEDAHAYGPEALHTVVKMMTIAPILRNGIPSMLNRVI